MKVFNYTSVAFMVALVAFSSLHAKLGKELFDAASKNNVHEMKRLILEGADVNFKGFLGNSTLLFAASNGDLEIVKLLITKGAKVNQKNHFGIAPLHNAAENGHTKVVEALLKEGKAQVNIQDKNRNTPLHLAAEKGRIGSMQALIGFDAKLTIKNKQGQTPLDLATKAKQKTAINVLKAAMGIK